MNYWERFSEEAYATYVQSVETATKWPPEFRLAEMPIFLTDDFQARLIEACESILAQLRTPEFASYSQRAIPEGWQIPGCDGFPQFLQIDFGVCEEHGRLVPRLIELQGFASMFAFQVLVDRGLRGAGLVPDGWTCYHSGLDESRYLELLGRTILGGEKAENVALLEVHPGRQKTRIDFAATEQFLGIPTVCVTEVRQEGSDLYYERGGRKIPIHRLYNRVILDEFLPLELKSSFDVFSEINARWICHPDWFLRISKHSIPFLKHPSVPEAHFISDLESYPDDLDQWVLKPLFSFAGAGVKIGVTREDLDAVEDRTNWILQRRVQYAECIETPEGKSKAEVRMMLIGDPVPMIANTLVRMSRGATANVAANRTQKWVGATTGYHRV